MKDEIKSKIINASFYDEPYHNLMDVDVEKIAKIIATELILAIDSRVDYVATPEKGAYINYQETIETIQDVLVNIN